MDEPVIDQCPVCGCLHATPTEGAACEGCEPSLPEMPCGGVVARGPLLLHVGGDAVDAFRYGLDDLAAALATKLGPLLHEPPRARALSITIPGLFNLRSMLEDFASRPEPWRPSMIMSVPDFKRLHEALRAVRSRRRPRQRAWRRPRSGRRR